MKYLLDLLLEGIIENDDEASFEKYMIILQESLHIKTNIMT